MKLKFGKLEAILFVLFNLLVAGPASAQCNGVFGANTVCGSIAGGIPGQVATSSFALTPGGVSGNVQTNNGSGGLGGITDSALAARLSPLIIIASPAFAQVRLTLTQGTPVTTSDVAGATSVFLEPFTGNQISLYTGTAWVTDPVAASTYSLPATQTQSGTTHTNTLLDGLTDTSQMVVGEQVTGTNIAANSVISVINSLTSVTLNNATVGSATNTMTFKLPPATNYDIYAQNNSGVPKLVWSLAWANDTTPPARGLQDGQPIQSGVATNRLLGSIRTTAIAGQIEDSVLRRFVSNLYNPQPRQIRVVEATASWAYVTLAWRQANANTANQADVIFTVAAPAFASVRHMFSVTTTAGNAWSGIGIDSTTIASSQLSSGGTSSNVGGAIVNLVSEYEGVPGIGHHSIVWLEYGLANATFYSTAGTVDGRANSGLVGGING